MRMRLQHQSDANPTARDRGLVFASTGSSSMLLKVRCYPC
jgi:hypothetical protein